jgi:hypothetical protein
MADSRQDMASFAALTRCASRDRMYKRVRWKMVGLNMMIMMSMKVGKIRDRCFAVWNSEILCMQKFQLLCYRMDR